MMEARVLFMGGVNYDLFFKAKAIAEILLSLAIVIVDNEDDDFDFAVSANPRLCLDPSKKYLLVIDGTIGENVRIPANVFVTTNSSFISNFTNCVDKTAQDLGMQFIPLLRYNDRLARILVISSCSAVTEPIIDRMRYVYPMAAVSSTIEAQELLEDEDKFDIVMLSYIPFELDEGQQDSAWLRSQANRFWTFYGEVIDLFLKLPFFGVKLMVVAMDSSRLDCQTREVFDLVMRTNILKKDGVTALSLDEPICDSEMNWPEILWQVTEMVAVRSEVQAQEESQSHED